MRTNIFIVGLCAIVLSTLLAGAGEAAAIPAPPWTRGLTCTPSTQWASSGEYITFTAYMDYVTQDAQIYPQRELTWTAVGGHPSSGTGWSFGTRFYTESLNETRVVTVTDGYRTATCTVYVYGPSPTWTPEPSTLRCSASESTIDSGDRVTFTARGGDDSYSWYAPDGSPSYGDGKTFRTRFTNDSWYSQYRTVTVSSGWQTATCGVWVNGTEWTPTPTPHDYLRCTVDATTVDSGERVTFKAYDGDDDYSFEWYAADGSPNSDTGATFRTRFTNDSWYSQYRSATVTRGWQTATCGVWVNGSSWTPTPYPTWYPTPYPTWYPTPTVYPYVDTGINLTQAARNVTRGQTGEFSSVTARGGDTIDLIVRLRSANSQTLSSGFLTVLLPSGVTYLSGTTSVNGYAAGDGVTSSGISVGEISPAAHTTVKFSVRVEESAIPAWGTVTVSSTAQARADGVATVSRTLPLTLGTNASITAVASVKTGPLDTFWVSLFLALVATGTYAAYTRTDLFGRRMTAAELVRLTRRSSGLNFSR